MPDQEFTLAALATCAEREARMRRQVYQSRANKAGNGPRALSVAEQGEIAMMAQIGRDYREAAALIEELPAVPVQVFGPACAACGQQPRACVCKPRFTNHELLDFDKYGREPQPPF